MTALAKKQLNHDDARWSSEAERVSSAVSATVQRLSGIGGWSTDIVSNRLFWSEELYRITGRDPQSFPTTIANFLSIVHPDDLQRVEDARSATLQHNTPYDIEYRIIRPDGTERVVRTQAETTLDQNGKVVCLTGTAHDVTELRGAERRADAALARIRTQLEVIRQIDLSDAILSGDVEALAREMTELASHATGCERVNVWLFDDTETELHCIDLFESTPARHSSGMILSDKDFGDEIAVIKASRCVAADDPLTDPRTRGYVEPYLKPQGITSMLDAVVQASGQHFGLLCFEHVDKAHSWTRDEIDFACQLADKLGLAFITRLRRQAEDEVATSEEKYRNLVESTTDYIWEIDQDGCYTYVSPAVKALLGHEPQDLLGKSPFDQMLMVPEEAERVSALFARCMGEWAPFSQIENCNRHRNGSEVILESSGVPTFDKAGVFTGYRGIDRDVTQRKSAESALLQREALLHAVAQSATELVSASSLDEALPKALELVGKTLGIERMSVLEGPECAAQTPILRYLWHVPEIDNPVDAEFFSSADLLTPVFEAWRAPLFEGRIVMSNRSNSSGEIKSMLDGVGTKTLLLIPIMIDGRYWGQLGFESCRAERLWADFEIEILQMLGELIANSIRRERYVKEIANANRILHNTPTLLYRLHGEPSLPMLYVSQNVRLFGHEPAELMASPHLYKALIHPDDAAAVGESLAHVFDNGGPPGVSEFRMRTGSGDYRWVENRFTPVRDAAGRLVELEGLLIDITEHKTAEAKILHLARTDQLTGLANRATFMERLRQAFASARRGAPAFALLSLDIDNFKEVNDTLGHPVGDQLLRTVGERLRANVRETDIVARLGGDEFAILQFDLADTADAGALAIKIRSALAMPVSLDGNELSITASIGISTFGPEIAGPEGMLVQSDLALYRAKEEGRDQYRFHTQEIDVQVREQVMITDDLALALSRGEFELQYEPQIELCTGRLVGMEALLRWRHPTRGLLMPPEFLCVAEKSGAITGIGYWMIDHACRQISLWRDSGSAPLTVSVGISYAQIRKGGEFVQFVTDALAQWGVAPGELELGVTEYTLMRATMAQNDVLDRLQELGARISIDDFGARCSTFDYLRTCHVSRLRISPSLFDAAAKDADGAAILRAIVGMAHELSIEVIKHRGGTQPDKRAPAWADCGR